MRAVIVVLALSAIASACGSDKHSGPPSDVPTINFGSSVDQTGSLGSPTWTQTIQFAVDEANQGLKQAGVSAFAFKVSTNDSTNTPSVALQQAQTEVFQNRAVAVIADASQDDIVTNELNYDSDPTKRLNVPIVCTACTSPSINSATYVNASDALDQTTRRDPNHWNYRTTMSSTLEAKVLVGLLLAQGSNGDVNGDGTFKISTYASDEPFGQGFEAAIKAALAVQAPTAIMEALRHPGNADPNTYDWTGGLTRLTDNQTESAAGTVTDVVPDAIVEMSFAQLSAAMVKAYVAGGFTTPFFHTHNIRTQVGVQELGTVFVGNRGTSHVLTDGDSGAGFALRWRASSGLVASFWDSNAYDSAMVIMLAALVALHDNNLTDPLALTGPQVRDGFAKINDKSDAAMPVVSGADGFESAVNAIANGTPIDYQGASGPMDFDNGNVIDNVAAWDVEHEAFVDKVVYDCVTSDACAAITN